MFRLVQLSLDEMNSLEDKNKKTMQKGLRYWQMIRDKENKMYA